MPKVSRLLADSIFSRDLNPAPCYGEPLFAVTANLEAVSTMDRCDFPFICDWSNIIYMKILPARSSDAYDHGKCTIAGRQPFAAHQGIQCLKDSQRHLSAWGCQPTGCHCELETGQSLRAASAKGKYCFSSLAVTLLGLFIFCRGHLRSWPLIIVV